MAFTAVHYPMDKDQHQLPYWPDNDELVAVGPESFFDQFVTFDAGDPGGATVDLSAEDLFEEDPPSPSLILDSLKDDSLTNSSNGQQDHHPNTGQLPAVPDAVDPTGAVSAADTSPFPISSPREIANHIHNHHHNGSSAPPPDLLSVLANDPVLGGSISDSELLRLEGISLRSPKANATAPSSPLLLAPANTPSLSPRKHNRFVQSVHSTIRRVTHRSSRPALAVAVADHSRHIGPHSTPIMDDMFKRDARSAGQYQQPQEQHHFQQQQYTDANVSPHHHGHVSEGLDLMIKAEPVDNDGLPLSPPLTGTIPAPGQHGMRFVSGHLDDPFSDSLMGAAVSTGIQGQDTPLSTPLLEGNDPFYQHAMSAVTESSSGGNHAYGQVKQEAHQDSTATWSTMNGLLATTPTDDTQLWSTSSAGANAVYNADNSSNHNGHSGDLLGSGWWDIDGEGHNHHHHHASSNVSPMHNNSSSQSQQQILADLSYEFANSTDELSGLMIHMPQPRQPQAAVLSAATVNSLNLSAGNDDGDDRVVREVRANNGSSFPMPTLSSTPSHHHYHGQQQQQQQHYHQHTPHHSTGGEGGGRTYTERRPRPRAPSSGARHHGSMTSPRKLQHSRSAYSIRESSTSPTPTHARHPHYPHPHPHPHHHSHQQHRSSSISVRKRRSFNNGSSGGSGGNGSNRRAGSSSHHHHHHHHEPQTPRSATSSGSFGGDIGGGGGGGGNEIGGGATATTPRGRASGTIGFVNFTPSDKNVLMTGVAPSGSSKTKARREKEMQDRQRKLSEATIRAVKAAGGDVDKFIEQGVLFVNGVEQHQHPLHLHQHQHLHQNQQLLYDDGEGYVGGERC